MKKLRKLNNDFLRAECVKRNFIFVKKCDNPNRMVIKNRCGHETEVLIHGILKNKVPRCFECFDKKLNEEANSAGLLLIGRIDSNKKNSCDYRKYKVLKCGHEYVSTLQVVRQLKTFKCKICLRNEYANLAGQHGFQLLESSGKLKTVACNTCGSSTTVQSANLRHTIKMLCKTCEKTYHDFPSNLYLVRFSTSVYTWLKFGISNNISKRMQSVVDKDVKCDILYSVTVQTGRDAIKIEKEIHKKLKKIRLDSNQAKSYGTLCGFTECYRLEDLETIKKTIEQTLESPLDKEVLF